MKEFFKSTGGIITTIVILVLVLGTVLFLKEDPADPGEPLEPMGQSFPEYGRDHIEVGAVHDPYNSNPPTSGPHYATPATRNFYDDTLPDEQLIHNLEHGEIWISFKSGVDDKTRAELRAIQGRHRSSVVVTRRDDNPQNICLASWTRLLCQGELELTSAENFIKANINLSPEPIAR